MCVSLRANSLATYAADSARERYDKLATSAMRLSTGLRINQAADDASGLAVRELMRADIAATQQGIRNATDAISMLQTVDAALAVIDEKLIRMKELAEQAATGSYNDVQRVMISDEFMMMGSEIDRIANTTNFNRIKILNEQNINIQEDIDENKIQGTILSNNNSIINITTEVNGADETIKDYLRNIIYNLEIKYDENENVWFTTSFRSRDSLSAIERRNTDYYEPAEDFISFYFHNTFSDSSAPAYLDFLKNPNEDIPKNDEKLIFLNNSSNKNISLDSPIKIHFGSSNIFSEDYYYIHINNVTTSSLGLNNILLQSQEESQKALGVVDSAIVKKDQIRAYYGTMQNRLENTIANLKNKVANLTTAESRISDADIAQEMTNFVTQKILSQTATALLAQANTMPQIALKLLNG